MGPVIATTDRLALREWSAEDVERFMLVASDPEVMRFITGGVPMDVARVNDFIGRQIALASSRGWCRWALEALDDPGGPMGFCGPGCTFAPDIEVGWWVRRDLWGRGLATEAAQAAIEYCFHTVGLARVVSVIHPENERSKRVAEKLGMSRADDFTYQGLLLQRWRLENPGPVPPEQPHLSRSCT